MPIATPMSGDLTRSQFLQKRPAGHYQNYVNFVNKRRTARAAVAAADPLTSLISSLSINQTPAALAKSSAQSVSDALAERTAATQAAYKQQQTDLDRQATRAQGFAEAMGRLTAPDPAAIGAQYRESADRLRAYGTGLTGSVAEAQQANADKARAAVSQVLGEPADVHGYDPAALRNVAQMTNIVNPGETLEMQARDAVSRAAYGRAASGANVEAIAQGFVGKQGDLTKELTAKIAEIEATRPGLLRQELASEQGQARQNIATAISALALQGTNALKGAQTAATTAKTTGQKPGGGAAAGQWYNPITKAYEPLGTNTTVVSFNGKQTRVPVGYTVKHTKGGDVFVPPPKAASPGSAGTAAGKAKAVESAIKNASTDVYKVVDKAPFVEVTNGFALKNNLATVPIYKQLMSTAAARKSLLSRIPVNLRSNARVIAIVNQALASVGYKT